MAEKGCLFVVSGPSGAGKSTIIQAVLKKHPEIGYSISYTTRQPRGHERDGVAYRFVKENVFKKMIDAGQFLEWAHVHGYYYGTPADFIERAIGSGRDVLLDIDVEGAKTLLSKCPDAISIFIAPPDMETLKTRLFKRATDLPEVVLRRLENAEGELAESDRYDHVLINRDLNHTISELESIMKHKRSCSRSGKGKKQWDIQL